jgi:large subunit ribosomal protein L25
MQLTVSDRLGDKKSGIKKVRREGNIPAVLYSAGQTPEKIIVNGQEFSTILRTIKPGHLPTTVFTLTKGKKTRKAILKDIQYQITSYTVSHLDFEELHEQTPVNVKVPISCIGAADCVGVKLGGFLRQVMRYIKVQCLPKQIPTEFLVEVQDLGIRQSKRLSDIQMPAGVKPLAALNEVVVVVAKR